MGVDFLCHPTLDGIYGDDYIEPTIPLGQLEHILEGKQRPGHYEGVAKVVKRFFDIIKPQKVYFGQKDFQQTVVINHLIEHYRLPIELVVCPIVRESHGLAMSSRNEHFSPQHRDKAAFIYKSLLKLKERFFFKSIEESISQTERYMNSVEDAHVEYLVCVDGYTLEPVFDFKDHKYIVVLTVVKYAGVRLLDNIIIKRD